MFGFGRRRRGGSGDILMMQKMPRELFFVEPMDCKSVESLPSGGEDWQYEIKFDGYRAIAIKQGGEVQLFSRRGKSFNSAYPEIVDALGNLRAKSFILDGELIALDQSGLHSFSLLQKRTPKRPLHFYVFDLLHLDGKDLISLPLRRRRAQLETAFPRWPEPLRLSPLLTGSLAEITQLIREFQFEGVVAKHLQSPYKPGEEPGTWQKLKLQLSEDFIIGGYIPGPNGVDQLVVGVRRDGKLLFVESVKNGFVPTTRRQVRDAIEPLRISECPFSNLPEKKRAHAMDREKMRKVRWVKPTMLCEVAFNEWTRNLHLRHSRFLRLREKSDTRRKPSR